MIRKIKAGTEIIELDTNSLYSGIDNPNDNEKAVRKAISLPVTKQLVYYNDKTDFNSIVNVVTYQLIEMYDNWYTIEITTEDGAKHKLHSGYLCEMQKPSFIVDMAKQME